MGEGEEAMKLSQKGGQVQITQALEAGGAAWCHFLSVMESCGSTLSRDTQDMIFVYKILL